jgi:hypothetical protein
MVDPKKHHYVPRSILRRFSIGDEGRQVHVFDKATRRTYKSAINDAGAENHFYSVEVGDQRLVLERLFNDIDDEGATLLDKICRERSLGSLSEAERLLLCEVAAAQLLRVKGMRRELIEVSRQLLGLLKKYGGASDEELDEHVMTDGQARRTSIEYLAELPSFAGPFREKDLVLITSEEESFLIGDNPVVVNNSFPYGDLGLSSPGVEIYLPISRDLVVGFYCRSIRDYLERFEARGQREYQPLLESIRSGEPIEFAPEKIRFINQLQVLRSTQYLYSAEQDFSLVLAMLERDPGLAQGRGLIKMGWEGYTHRESMPMGTFVVAVGQVSHYMIPAEIVDEGGGECEWAFQSPLPAMVREAIADSPFREVTLFVDKTMRRQTRDVIFLMRENGLVCVRMRDEALHQLFLTINSRGNATTGGAVQETEESAPEPLSGELVSKTGRETVQDFVTMGRQLVAEGKIPETELEGINEIEECYRDATQEEWENFIYFWENFARGESDPIVLVESGDRIVQEKVREFIELRLPNPAALEVANFAVDHYMALGEALCFAKQVPAQIWRRARLLHHLRIIMTPALEAGEMIRLTEEFLSEFEDLQSGESLEKLKQGIAIVYNGLCFLISIAREPE